MTKIERAKRRKKLARLAFLQRAAARRGIELVVLPTCQTRYNQIVGEVKTVAGVPVVKSRFCYGCEGACKLVENSWFIPKDAKLSICSSVTADV